MDLPWVRVGGGANCVVGVETTRLGWEGDTELLSAELFKVGIPTRGGRGGGFMDEFTTARDGCTSLNAGLEGRAGGGGSVATGTVGPFPKPLPSGSRLLFTTEW